MIIFFAYYVNLLFTEQSFLLFSTLRNTNTGYSNVILCISERNA